MLALAGLLAACEKPATVPDSPGARLENAAVARGLVPDPARGTLVGIWSGETDRACIVGPEDRLRLGVAVDYGEGQGCAASGQVERRGGKLRVSFGECRFDATYDGERIVFPATMPATCDRYCTGRASLSALSVARLSESASEAASMRDPRGRPLCGG